MHTGTGTRSHDGQANRGVERHLVRACDDLPAPALEVVFEHLILHPRSHVDRPTKSIGLRARARQLKRDTHWPLKLVHQDGLVARRQLNLGDAVV